MHEQQTTPGTSSPQREQSTSRQGTLDIEKLAERVYHLMQAEARLSRARGQTRPGGR